LKAEVFDDRLSLVHPVFGFLTFFFRPLFFVFVGYELVEFAYRYRKRGEGPAEFVGDLLEFMVGLGLACLLLG